MIEQIQQSDEAQGSRQKAKGSAPPREASVADLDDLRDLLIKRSLARREDNTLRFADLTDGTLAFVAINIAARTLRDEIRELEIRSIRGLPAAETVRPFDDSAVEGAADARG